MTFYEETDQLFLFEIGSEGVSKWVIRGEDVCFSNWITKESWHVQTQKESC